MYQQTEFLTRGKHGTLRFNPNTGYAFCATENFAPVFLQELGQIVREYVLCFPNNYTDLPHVLLGTIKGRNAYVDRQDQWLGNYVPATLRRYPFTLAKVDGNSDHSDAYTLAIDVNAPHLATHKGTPLFDDVGQVSSFVQNRIELLKGIEAQRRLTQKAVQLIEELGLFKMQQLTIKKGEEVISNIGGLRNIDQERLAGLDPDAMKALQVSGALELIVAHKFSLTNMHVGRLNENLNANMKLHEELKNHPRSVSKNEVDLVGFFRREGITAPSFETAEQDDSVVIAYQEDQGDVDLADLIGDKKPKH